MSDDKNTDLGALEARVDELINTVNQLKSENSTLKNQQENLVSERAILIEKNRTGKNAYRINDFPFTCNGNAYMSNKNEPVSITILDKEYLINCKNGERESLLSAVDYVNQQILELKKNSNITGAERIAVMTMLNIANELLTYKKENQDYTFEVNNTLTRLQGKINAALTEEKQIDMADINQPVSQDG